MNDIKHLPNLGYFPYGEYRNYPSSAYDNSLSIYERMNALIQRINEITKYMNETNANFEYLRRVVEQLEKFVKDYFNNLDVQEEINNKLDEMLKDGKLQDILGKYMDNKKKESVNPLDYGAFGDGESHKVTAEELAEIQGVISVRFFVHDAYTIAQGVGIAHTTKNGEPLKKEDISIKGQDGSVFTNFTLTDKGTMTFINFNERKMAVHIEYTADKFNVGDEWDSVGIQRAVDSLVGKPNQGYPNFFGNTGGVVRIGKGKYNMSKPVIVPQSGQTSIVGSGETVTALFATVEVPALVMFTGGQQCYISSLTLDGNIVDEPKILAHEGLIVTGRSNLFRADKLRVNAFKYNGINTNDLCIFNSFKDINISRCNNGWHMSHGVNQCSFDTIRVDQCRKNGILVWGDTYNCYSLKFTNCIIEYNGNGFKGNTNIPEPVVERINGMELHSVHAVSIDTCYFENNGSGLRTELVNHEDPPSAIYLYGKDIDHLRNENITISNCNFSSHHYAVFARHANQLIIDNCNITCDKVQGGHPAWTTFPVRAIGFDQLTRYIKRVRNCNIYSNIDGYSLANGVYYNQENTGVKNFTNNYRTPHYRVVVQDPETGESAGQFVVSNVEAQDLFRVRQDKSGTAYVDYRKTNMEITFPEYVHFVNNTVKFSDGAINPNDFRSGDVVFNTKPVAGGYAGWILVDNAGVKVWKQYGKIED